MRLRFAPAALLFLAASASAPAFDRNTVQPGDVVTGDILVPSGLDEFPIRVAGGSFMTLTVSGAAPHPIRPSLGLYDDDYGLVQLVGVSPTAAGTPGPLSTGQYRVIVGGRSGAVGTYRLTVSVRPQTLFASGGTDADPAPAITFGAYPGFVATVSIKWKGAAPVTLTSVTGPDGAAVTSTSAPQAKSSTFAQGGFATTLLGDHVARFAVPAGTKSWSATVRLSGKLPRGGKLDFRTAGAPEPQTVSFPSGGHFPIVAVVGELGGPNDCVLSASSSVPDATFLVGAAGAGDCARTAVDSASPSTAYQLGCTDGFVADVSDVERYADGPWAGYVKSFVATSVRSPQGSGRATLSDFAYDAAGRPTGWTEVRHFDASGRDHRLTFSDAAYFSRSGSCKAFRVVESLLVGGVPAYSHVADYAPFQ